MQKQLNIALIVSTLLMAACGESNSSSSGDAAIQPPPATEWAPGNYIINLYDAFGPLQGGLQHDFGFSALVRYNGTTILFDSGTNADILRANTAALGVDLRDVDLAVASHSHFDHISGFDYLFEVNPHVKLYFPNDVYWGADLEFNVAGQEPEAAANLPVEQRYFNGEKEKFTFNQSGRFWKANVEFVASHKEIAPGLTLIATRSPYQGYFSRYPGLGGIAGDGAPVGDVKTVSLPELSLNLSNQAGDVLMVGCSHSMVETIVRETKGYLKRDIGLVFGGYHLLPYTSAEVGEIAGRMKNELGVKAVAPAHCTGHAGFRVFQDVFESTYHAAGIGTTTAFPADRSR